MCSWAILVRQGEEWQSERYGVSSNYLQAMLDSQKAFDLYVEKVVASDSSVPVNIHDVPLEAQGVNAT